MHVHRSTAGGRRIHTAVPVNDSVLPHYRNVRFEDIRVHLSAPVRAVLNRCCDELSCEMVVVEASAVGWSSSSTTAAVVVVVFMVTVVVVVAVMVVAAVGWGVCRHDDEDRNDGGDHPYVKLGVRGLE